MKAGRRLWPGVFRAVDLAAAGVERLGVELADLTPARLVEEARRRTGLDDFGGEDPRGALEVLVPALREEARLTPLGRIAARTDLLRLLTNRLRLARDRERHRGIADEDVRRPLFVVGLPRTGTTFLHGLLARDPASRVPRTWEVMYPSPPPRADGGRTDPRVERVETQLAWFHRMAPDYRAAHPVGARLPQECIGISEHTFASPRFHRTHHVPSYRAWLESRDRREDYAFHRRFLRHLQWRCPGERWVLKSPPHTFWMDELHDVYPDARFVQTHRDPLTVVASFASHTTRLRAAFTDRPDTVDVDRLAGKWARGMEDLVAFRERDDVAEDAFLDVRHADLVRDPLGEVRRIYRHFGMPLRDEARRGMQRFALEHPRDRHGVHRYTLAEWGLDPETHGPLFRRYRERFDVEVWEEDRRKAWPDGGGR